MVKLSLPVCRVSFRGVTLNVENGMSIFNKIYNIKTIFLHIVELFNNILSNVKWRYRTIHRRHTPFNVVKQCTLVNTHTQRRITGKQLLGLLGFCHDIMS